MTRWRAAASHLVLSAVVIGGIAVTAFLLWYPHGLYKVAGLDHLLLVMLGIDLTAGPLLTLIVYKAGKKTLRFDLACIAVAQLAFLGYGLHTLWLGRPVFLVGTPDTFTLVFASEVGVADLASAPKPEWRRLSWTGPQLVGTRMPDDPARRQAVIEEFMRGGAGIERSPRFYLPYADVAPELLRKAATIVSKARAISDADIRSAGKPTGKLLSIPVVSRRGEGVMLIDAENGMPLQAAAAP